MSIDDNIQLTDISFEPSAGGLGGFYVNFKDGLNIQYEPQSELFDEKKKTLFINVDPDKVNISFHDERFNKGFNSDNETGVYLTLAGGNLIYNDSVVNKTDTYKEELDEWDDTFHLGCSNWPNCEILGCGNDDENPGHR